MAKNRTIPFGYCMKNGEITTEPKEVYAVVKIFDEYLKGRSLSEIAKLMQSEKIRYNADSDKWNKNMVKRIIENEKYLGTDKYPQIIDDDTFRLANKKRIRKATTLNLSEETASQIMDQHVLVIPDDARSGMIFLGNESASYKLGNVRLNLKNAIAAGLELLAAVSISDTFWNYLQLLISAAFFIQKSTKQEVEKEEAYILYFLHQQDCYKVGIKENDFEHRFEMWCQERQIEYPGKMNCEKAIKHLYKNKMIDIEAEMIYLKEQVIGHVTS